MKIDLEYLKRIEHLKHAEFLKEPKFLEAQKLFFDVVSSLGGEVDFDIADMREVHAVAALGNEIKGKRALDLACGSVEEYVLGDDFRDRYPPFLAEMLVRLGAEVTGVDIRENPKANYEHRVLDLTQPDWIETLDPPYDIIACLNLFNAPESPFEHDADLCFQIMSDMHALLASDGLLILTLRDDTKDAEGYLKRSDFKMIHMHGNCVWAKKA